MITTTKDPGFGYNSEKNNKPVINEDGTPNVIHENRAFRIDDLYTFFIELSWAKFFLLVILGYLILNIVFGLIYTFIGIEEITTPTGYWFTDFLNGFFFSAQTITTVGYGGISPQGILGNLIASFEALIGLLSFSFITGLLYGRFSRPKAAIRFSNNLIVRPHKDGRALMFRLMNSRKTIMIEPEAAITLSINTKNDNGDYKKSFYSLKLERQKITYLPTIWTIVHPIDEDSPFYKMSNDVIKHLDANMYVQVQYHEESFGQKVYQVTSYDFSNVLLDVKYVTSFDYNDDGYVVLNHDKLSQVEALS